MPYEFTFKINNNIQFQAFLQTKRCICISKNGNRCGKRVVIGAPYCWIHLLYQKHLRVEESNIPDAGIGLFALDKSEPDNAIIFRPGDKIITYDGQVINNDINKNEVFLFNYIYFTKKNNNNLAVCRIIKRNETTNQYIKFL